MKAQKNQKKKTTNQSVRTFSKVSLSLNMHHHLGNRTVGQDWPRLPPPPSTEYLTKPQSGVFFFFKLKGKG